MKKTGRFVGKVQAEKMVLDYILKNTPKNYSQFNPIKLEAQEIAKNTNLNLDIVEEALQKLGEEVPRIKKIGANFQFWLPYDEYGVKIENKLHQNNIIQSNLFIFSFIGTVLFFYLITWLVELGKFNLTTLGDYFFVGAISVGISIYVAKIISNKFYALNERIKNVEYYDIYVWLFVLFTVATIFLWNSGLDKIQMSGKVLFYSSIIANFVTLVAFITSLIKNK